MENVTIVQLVVLVNVFKLEKKGISMGLSNYTKLFNTYYGYPIKTKHKIDDMIGQIELTLSQIPKGVN